MVKHGHWISEEEAMRMGDYNLRDTCSVCGRCDWDCTESENFNFCPNCGAKMDGDGDVRSETTYTNNDMVVVVPMVKTNADRLRAMSDEELCDAFCEYGYCPPEQMETSLPCYIYGCTRCWLDWLKQEVDNG